MKPKTNRATTLGLLFVLPIIISCSTAANTKSASGFLNAEKVQELVTSPNPPLVLDVRTSGEFEEGHLENALNIPVEEFATGEYKEKLGNIPKDKPIVVYCRSGRRSGIARKIMVRNGYTNVVDLMGGMIEWKKAGLPVSVASARLSS